MSAKLDQALSRLQSLAAVGSPLSARNKAEAAYGSAYHLMVLAGEAAKLPVRYATPAASKGIKTSKPSGNAGSSNGKHNAHPMVPGFQRNGYRCDPRWNPKVQEA